MLVEIAVADAYGACFEGSDLGHIIENNDMLKYHGEEIGLVQPGHYTDDTQMTIALAEAYVDGLLWDKHTLAEKFLEVFHRDPRRGYTGYFFNALSDSKNAQELFERIDGKSEKSGAAMRCGFLGYLPDIHEVVSRASVQATVTHDTPVGIYSAVAAALMVHYFEYDLGDRVKLGSWLNRKLYEYLAPEDLIKEWRNCWYPGDRITTYAWDCVNAAIEAIEQHDNTADILQQVVQWSGDTDTAAVIAIAAACRSKETKQNIPQVLYDTLENGEYGRDFLIGLNAEL